MSSFLSRFFLVLMLLAGAALLVFGRRPSDMRLPAYDAAGKLVTNAGPAVRTGPGGRTVVTYWEKWTRHEAEAMQDVVNRFNIGQPPDGIFVNLVSMSQVNQKMLIATAGGDPPDIAGLWGAQTAPYIANDAIEPLDDLVADGTITEHTYKPFIWDICAPRRPHTTERRLYAVSSTPSTCALYWNKDLFRAAGLDPEKPPATMEELDAATDKLTLRDAAGRLVRVGFLPNEPGWWDYAWGLYWGNNLYDAATDHFAIDTPAQVAAYTWYQHFAVKYGLAHVETLRSGFGQFNSPQNAFINSKVAMVVQGPFFAKFIELNNPALLGHYGVTFVPMPAALHVGPNHFALGDIDTWVVPRGARHRKEALEVLRFFTRRDNMEYLCSAHAKSSPLMDVSPDFVAKNPNPYIQVFEQTMLAPVVRSQPESPVWEQVQREIFTAAGNMWRDPRQFPVEPTLAAVQKAADGYVAEHQHYAALRRQRFGPSHDTNPGAVEN